MKNLTINLDDVEVSIDLKKIIDREVENRVKEVEKKLKKKYESEKLRIDHGGRREGNTYRTLLYAQLLASEKPDRNIFVVTHNYHYAKDIFKDCADTAYKIGAKVIAARRLIVYPNNSRVFFVVYDPDYEFEARTRGLRNVEFLFDNSVSFANR